MSLTIPRSTVSRSPSTTSVFTQVLTILATVFGLQLVRLFIPTLLFYLGDSVGLNIILLALVGSAVFLTGFLAAPVQRLFGLRGSLILVVAGLVFVRLGAQLSVSAPLNFVLSIAGTLFYLLYIPLALGAARASVPAHVTNFGLAFVLGVAADTAIHISAGTYDLIWQKGVLPTLIVFILGATLLVVLLAALHRIPPQAADAPWSRAWPLLAIGPWFALQLIVFQNPARAAAVTGWTLPAAAFLIMVGNILGLFIAAWFAGTGPRLLGPLAGAALVLILLSANPGSLGTALVILAGQLFSTLLLLRVLNASFTVTAPARGLRRTTIAYGLGFLFFALLFFGYNAPNNLAVPFSAASVLPIIALFLALPAALAPAPEPRSGSTPSPRLLALAAIALLLAPAGLALAWQPPQAVVPVGSETLRLLNYNLHNGFDITGRLDMQALAAVIESTDPDVIMLQEVSRGWVITGSLDMLTWLAHRLDMPYVNGSTSADRQWGNAILSRYPIVSTKTGSLPSEGLPLKRGYLQADVDTGQGIIHAVSTHLHQVVDASEIRQGQVERLLVAYEGVPLTIIAGDFNAEPHHREIEMMEDAGLIDIVGHLATGPVLTSPADAPTKRIDYIFSSADLVPESFSIPQTTASDHLPMMVVVRLPDG